MAGALGGPTETWGRTWQASELSPASFRVRITMNSDGSTPDFFLDWVPATVFYTGT